MEQGGYYHVFNRGNNRENIFREEKNYAYFMEKYLEHVAPHANTLAYCLMPDHFHFVISVKNSLNTSEVSTSEKNLKDLPGKPDSINAFETSKTSEVSVRSNILSPIEKGFKNFFVSYAKSINKKYRRTGSLFQSKFKKKLITNELYLKKVILYIHNN